MTFLDAVMQPDRSSRIIDLAVTQPSTTNPYLDGHRQNWVNLSVIGIHSVIEQFVHYNLPHLYALNFLNLLTFFPAFEVNFNDIYTCGYNVDTYERKILNNNVVHVVFIYIFMAIILGMSQFSKLLVG